MAWAFVQAGTTAVAEPGTTVSKVFPGNATTGNRIIVVCFAGWSSGSPSIINVTDSAGNTYTKDADHSQTTSQWYDAQVWSAPITAGGGTAITVTAHYV